MSSRLCAMCASTLALAVLLHLSPPPPPPPPPFAPPPLHLLLSSSSSSLFSSTSLPRALAPLLSHALARSCSCSLVLLLARALAPLLSRALALSCSCSLALLLPCPLALACSLAPLLACSLLTSCSLAILLSGALLPSLARLLPCSDSLDLELSCSLQDLHRLLSSFSSLPPLLLLWLLLLVHVGSQSLRQLSLAPPHPATPRNRALSKKAHTCPF